MPVKVLGYGGILPIHLFAAFSFKAVVERLALKCRLASS
jgi:hypothetical protein